MSHKFMKGDDAVVEKLSFPYDVTPKIDGYRCGVVGAKALTTSIKPFPNKYLQSVLGRPALEGLDGELTIGAPNLVDTFRRSGGVKRVEGEIDFTFHVFDSFDKPSSCANTRFKRAREVVEQFDNPHVVMLEPIRVETMADLDKVKKITLDQGYEGLMLRHPFGPYKFGRGTVRENLLLKLKTFIDFEAVVIGFVEQMQNTNEKTARGKRGTSAAGMVPKGTLGAFRVRAINGPYTGVEFEVGTGIGLTDALRKQVWENQARFLGRVMTLKCQDGGGYDKPRMPIYKSFRDPQELQKNG